MSHFHSVPELRPRRFAGAIAALLGLLVVVASCSEGPEGTTGSIRAVSQQEALDIGRSGEGPLLLDVRTEAEYRRGHVPGALNIHYTEVAASLAELEPYRERGVVVYCESGGRAEVAGDVLLKAGFDVGHLVGDMSAWRASELPVER